MKYTLVILLLYSSLSVSAATYYLSPSGNDSNPGTLSQPFFSLNKAWTVVSAGDMIYMRGGTYSYTSQQRLHGKSGTSGNLIKVWAYPGETPVITRANSWSWTDFRAGVFFMGNYCHFKGIQITGFDQRDGFVWTAMRCEDFNNNTFEFMDFSWSGLGSYMTGSCNNNLFLNCDWHDNYDPMTNYENADGLNFEGVKSGGSNTVRGCRFWNNSDDGLDIYDNDSYLLVENCWAWNQGYEEDGVGIAADGNGFKLGPTTISAKSTVLRKVVNCIAYHNQSWGYNQNGDALCNMELYNNIAYNNSFGSNWGGGFNFNVDGVAYYIKNNISYNDEPEAATLGIKTNVNHNSWDGSVTITNSDFVNLDASQLSLPRKEDGSLPDINFLRLATGSDLIDAGVNVGLAYTGANPDLGPNELQNGGTVVTPNPVFLSASIENASPSLLTMNYDLTLNNLIIPAASSFSVLVNSQSRAVNSVSLSDKKVILTLSSAARSGDIVTVAYTKPGTKPLQTSSGKEAATISAQKVTNKVLAISPVYTSSVIENATPAVLEMSYDLTLANIVPAASAFKVMVNSSARSISAVTVSGTKVMLTLSSPVVFGNTITVAYTKPSANPLQTASGAQAATIGAQKVTNNIRSAIPAFVSASIENATPSILSMTYNLALANKIPAASAFKVQVNSTTRTVKSVAISGTQVQLTLSTPVVNGNTVTVSYTKPSSNPLQTSAGGQAATISAQKVTNNVQTTTPIYVNSVIENATPTILSITYSLVLANKVPSASAFKVLVNSISRSVKSVAISGSKVFLTLSGPVVYGNTVTVSYTKPSFNPLQTSTGAQAETHSAQAVKNNTISSINAAPSVAITAPDDSSTFTIPTDITITASASDTDGTITLVEFYNGTSLLGSDAASPYSFTWSTVSEGTYSITATATDNNGAKTTSSAITVSVATVTTPEANQPPTVSISNPSKGKKFFNPADIEIEVIASDPDGAISKVELFNGSIKLAVLTTSPYSFTWKGISAGTYQLKAVATDNLNATATTSLVEFKVGEKTVYDAASEIINLYPNPNNGNFNIEFLDPSKTEKSEIVISDLGGKQIYKETISAEETTKQFDLQDIRSGIYIMTVISKEIVVTKKIIIRQ